MKVWGHWICTPPPSFVAAQVGVEEVCGKIRVKVHWESEALASTPEDYPRLSLRDVFGPDQKVGKRD